MCVCVRACETPFHQVIDNSRVKWCVPVHKATLSLLPNTHTHVLPPDPYSITQHPAKRSVVFENLHVTSLLSSQTFFLSHVPLSFTHTDTHTPVNVRGFQNTEHE